MSFFTSPWVIGLSWVLVIALTAVNVVFFLKMKQASDQMMKMAFPGAKDMTQAMAQMQAMLGGRGSAGNANAQMKMAQDLLKQLQGRPPRR